MKDLVKFENKNTKLIFTGWTRKQSPPTEAITCGYKYM